MKQTRIAQRLERCLDMAKAEGSSPSVGIFLIGVVTGITITIALLVLVFISLWNVSH